MSTHNANKEISKANNSDYLMQSFVVPLGNLGFLPIAFNTFSKRAKRVVLEGIPPTSNISVSTIIFDWIPQDGNDSHCPHKEAIELILNEAWDDSNSQLCPTFVQFGCLLYVFITFND